MSSAKDTLPYGMIQPVEENVKQEASTSGLKKVKKKVRFEENPVIINPVETKKAERSKLLGVGIIPISPIFRHKGCVTTPRRFRITTKPVCHKCHMCKAVSTCLVCSKGICSECERGGTPFFQVQVSEEKKDSAKVLKRTMCPDCHKRDERKLILGVFFCFLMSLLLTALIVMFFVILHLSH